MDDCADFENFLTVDIARLSARLEQQADLYLREVAGIGVFEWRVLLHLQKQNNRRPIEIAKVIIREVSQVMGDLASLSRGDYVRSGQGDAGLEFWLTDRGQDLYDRVFPLMVERHSRLIDGFSHGELASLRAAMRKLRERGESLMLEDPPGSPVSELVRTSAV